MECLKQKSVLICHPHLYDRWGEGTQSEHEDCPKKHQMQPRDSHTVQTLSHDSNYLLTFSKSSSFSSIVAFLLASAACWSLAFTIVSTHWWHFFNRSWNANLSYYHLNKQQLRSEACSTNMRLAPLYSETHKLFHRMGSSADLLLKCCIKKEACTNLQIRWMWENFTFSFSTLQNLPWIFFWEFRPGSSPQAQLTLSVMVAM